MHSSRMSSCAGMLRGLTVAALALITVGSSAAFAVDAKVLPGAACQPTSSGLPYSIDSVGRISNPAAGLSSFSCPVVRDATGFSVADGKVWVIDQNPAANFICTLNMQNAGSIGAGFLTVASSGGTSPLPQLLDFAGLPSIANGYLTITCSAPGVSGGVASRLVAYRVDENP
jgi:hypothetical protein